MKKIIYYTVVLTMLSIPFAFASVPASAGQGIGQACLTCIG